MAWPPAIPPARTVLDLRRSCFPTLTTDDVGFVEEVAGEPVGYCGVVVIRFDSGIWINLRIAGLSGLCVAEGHRGRRIGSRLVGQAEQWGRENECQYAGLFTGTPGFYERLGYKVLPARYTAHGSFLGKRLAFPPWPLEPPDLGEGW